MKKLFFILLLLSSGIVPFNICYANDVNGGGQRVGDNLIPLHVEGRYFKDPAGNVVNLHGFAQTYSSYFNEEGKRWNNYDVEGCLNYNKDMIDKIIEAGWKVNFMRLHMDPYWSSDPQIYHNAGDESDIRAFSMERFKKYLAEVYPLMKGAAEFFQDFLVKDPETGYMSHPSVVSGPYTLTSWDGEVAEFAINPYYKGNAAGEKPAIPTLIYTMSQNETEMEDLISGKFGLLNKVTRTDVITSGIAQVGDEQQNIKMSNYPRCGLSYISFACEKATVSSETVRQAIVRCLDREQLTADYTGNYGTIVNGYYGLGQWMYGVAAGTIAPPVTPPEDENDLKAQEEYLEKLAAFEALNLDNLTEYTLDTETAASLLEQDGWILNDEGLREKDGVVLDLKLIYPEGNQIAEYLEKHFKANLEQVGIRLTMEALPMGELLSHWYRQTERDEDMIYLASNFDLLFDPSVYFNDEGEWAYTSLADEKLYEEAISMRKTEPSDVLTYIQHWIAFQERFTQTLPMIPLYSNIYFDFYTGYLQNYRISQNATWGEAIVGAYLSAEEPAEEGEEELTLEE